MRPVSSAAVMNPPGSIQPGSLLFQRSSASQPHAPGAHVDLGLVVEFELVGPHRVSQAVVEGQGCGDADVHALGEKR